VSHHMQSMKLWATLCVIATTMSYADRRSRSRHYKLIMLALQEQAFRRIVEWQWVITRNWCSCEQHWVWSWLPCHMLTDVHECKVTSL
jgi:hypothetical protein